jgi:phosphate transport system substrate-binding protein
LSPADGSRFRAGCIRACRLAGVLAGVWLICGCGGDSPNQGLSGTVTIDGSSVMAPFVQEAADRFHADDPGVRVTVGASGTANGFEKLCLGETDVSDAARPISPAEATICREHGTAYRPLTVAVDGITIAANPQLGVDCLSMAQLARLWGEGSKVDKLSELGRDANSGAALSEAEMSLYGPETDSDTYEAFTAIVNGESGAGRRDFRSFGDEEDLAGGISGDDAGLGFLSFAAFMSDQSALDPVAVDAGHGCVAPSVETIQDGSYPLTRPLSMFVGDKAVAEKPALAQFLGYIRQHEEEIAGAVGVVPPGPRAKARFNRSLERLTGG